MYKIKIKTTWADCDANAHVKNTAFSEFATHCRLSFFEAKGFPPKKLAKHQIGPVIMREEVLFFREVSMMEMVEVSCALQASTADYSKFSFLHQVFKENGKKAAQLTVEGLWLDLNLRKATIPPDFLQKICAEMPKTANFEWLKGRK